MKVALQRNAKVAQQPASFALRPIAYGVMLACSSAAWANPTGPQVMHGAAQIQGLGSNHLKVTNTPGSIIHWQGFSIGAGQATQFIQQSASSSVLNRVVGADISQIHGQLLSNGRVFLINPAGILIGAGAVIDTAGFVGSTLNMLDGDFLAGKLKFQGGEDAGSIVNQGWIKAGQGGNIVLVAPNIENSGIIQTEGGEIVLAAGHKMTIGSMELEGVQFEIQAPENSVLNVGKLLADGGAVGVFAGTLKHSGDIRANALTRDEAGRIVLKGKEDVTLTASSTVKADGKTGGAVTVQSESGTTLVSGTVEARGTLGKGGDIRLLGERAGIVDHAVVDASGEAGGGQILVGGDYQGRNADVQNATRALVGADAILRADAGANGDGGKVIVWADGDTRFNGAISARGGVAGGDGGLVETSGKESLAIGNARVDTRAPAGRTGTWLLDPENITIGNTASATTPVDVNEFEDDGTPGGNGTAGTGSPLLPVGFLNNATSNIVLQANNDITFGFNVTMTNLGVELTAQAGRSIIFSPNIVLTTNNGNVSLTANETVAAGVFAGLRAAGAGVITMGAGSAINAGTANVTLQVNTGQGHAGTSGNISVEGVTAANVTIRNDGPTAGSGIVRSSANSLITSTLETTLKGAAVGAVAAPMRLSPGAGSVSANATGAGVNDGIFIQHPVGSGDIVVSRYTLFALPGTDVILTTVNDQITVDASLNLPGVDITLNPSGTSESVVFSAASTINANSLTLGGTRFIDFNSGAGIVDLNTPVTMNQLVQINGGTVNFDGASTIAAGALEPRLTLAGGTLAGTNTLTVNGNALWSGGGMGVRGLNAGGTTAITGTLTMDGANKFFLDGRTLTVGGATTWSAGNVLADGGAFTNTGALNIQGDVLWTQNTPGAAVTTFTNTGGITRSNTAGLAALDRAVVNGVGAINVQTGSLRLSGNGVADGSAANPTGLITVTGGATLLFGGGTYTLPNNVTGAGNVDITGGIFNLNGNYTAGPLRVLSATSATFANPMTPASLEVSGSTVTLTGNTTIAGALTFSSGTLTGGGNITANGAFNWSGGTLTGTGAFTTTNAANTLTGPVTLDGRTWTNNGTVSQTGIGKLTLATNAIVNNNNIWNLRPNELNPITGVGTFNNDGTLLNDLPLPPVTHTVSPTTFNNTNLVNVTEGTLVINANGTHAGNFDAGADGVIDFAGGTHNFNAGTVLQGDGTIRFTGTGAGTIPLAGGGNFDDLVNLVIAGGSLTVNNTGFDNITNTAVSSGTLTLAGAGNTDTLTVSGSGAVNVDAALTVNQTLSISGGALNVNAPTSVQQAATVSGGTVGGSGALTLNGINNVLSGGNLTGAGLLTTGAASTTSITGSVNLTDKTWNNAGAVTLTGNSQIVLAGLGGTPVTFNNQAGAVFTDNSTNATPITIGSTPANKSFVNAGTFNKDAVAAQTINAPFDNTGTVNINSGMLTLSRDGGDTGTYDIDAGTTLQMSGGTRDFNAGVALLGGGTFQQTGGTLNVNTPLVLANAGPTFALSGGTLNGTAALTFNGPFNWSGGTIQGGGLLTTSGTATTSITGNVSLTDKTWNNAGPVSLTGNAQIALAGLGATPVTFNNQAGAVFADDSTNATPITIGSTPANKSFVNAGTFDKNAAAAQTINAPFSNSGTFNIHTGTLTLSGDGTDTGTYDINAGATLMMSGGTRDFNGALALLGGGTFQQSGGTLNVNTPLAIANAGPTYALSGGTLNGTADFTLNGPFNWSGGTIQGVGALTTSGTATTSITGNVILTDKTWNNAGPVSLTGNAQIALAGLGGTPVTFNNQAGAVFTDNSTNATPVTIGSTPANKSFVNAGIFNKDAAAAQTINAPFSNSGTVNINAGTLTLSVDGADNGTYEIDPGTTLLMSGGTRDFNAGIALLGGGTFQQSGGTLNVNTPLAIANAGPTYALSGGTLNGTADFTLNGPFNWSGGTIQGVGALTTSGTATTSITGNVILTDKTWNNAGAVTLTGNAQIALGGLGGTPVTFNNQAGAVFTDNSTNATPVTIGSTPANKSFVNAGTFDKNAAAAQTINAPFSNTGTAILNVNAGTLQFNAFPANAGTINLANNATLSTNGNDLASSGTIGGIGTLDLAGGLLTNSGTLRPGASPGTLNITGNLMMTGASVTDIEIQAPGTTPGTDYDVINVTGQVDFNGTLNVLHLGGFNPPAGAGFTIFNYAASTGDFATKNVPIGYTYSTTVDPTSYILGVTSFQNIWIFAGDGQWTETAKWSLGRAPIATDDTVIPDRAGFNTITVAAGNQTAAKLTTSENLVIAGGQLTLGAGPSTTNANLDIGGGILIADGPLTANALSLTGGALQGTGAVTVGNNFTFTGGVLANTGGVTVAGNTIVNAGTPQLNGLLSTAVLDVNGATLGIGTGGILTLTGAGASQIVNGAVNNIGIFRLNTPGNVLGIGTAGSFNNDATGTFDVQNDIFLHGVDDGVFNNAGTFLKSGGTGDGGADATLPFNNNGGQIVSQMGALRLTGGGTHTGQFRTGGNGVNLDGGTHVFAPGSSIEGNFVFLNGGAMLDATGGPVVNSALTWNGPGTITGGTLTIAPGGDLHIVGTGNHILDNVIVNNQGTTTYSTGGNGLLINNGAEIHNVAGSTFAINNDLFVANTAGTGTFRNAGSVTKTGGPGIGGFAGSLTFANDGGTLDAQSGTLEFGGVSAFNDGTQFIGVGNNVVSGNSAFNGTITSNGLTLQNGTFSGNANLVGTTNWTGGTMTGTFTIPMGSVVNLTGASSKGITGTTLTNAGILALVGTGNLVLNNGGVTNTGVLDIQSDADITQGAASTLTNAGTLMKSGGAGTSSIGGPGFNMTNPGTLHVRSGTLEVNGLATNAGALTIDAGTTFSTAGNPLLNQGAIRGNGVLQLAGAALTNEALVAPGASPGTLLIDGDFVQTPAGVLAIDLGGTNQGVTYDLLQITGNAVLDGILNVTNVGTFVPGAGDNFVFMTYNSHTGNFATFNFPVGTQLQASPGATAYAVVSQSAFNGAGIATEPMSETRRLYDHFLEIIPEDAVEKPARAALICD